ncbi:acyl-CoA dehydrogenase [Maritimibacter dapengensis]|uniref:Acyl-CoA dehydrogenase n=1 Tax=Maritimibacter dapengensis TaxID=2836868 RepID=A0ABS6T5C5_9RHOB|nr:acyl-CoA dehydrogenase [Maritimibacter dapengensis]MBV7379751.1 acyl-CoA dehydrogenase [Maritimibacter dapengensis]
MPFAAPVRDFRFLLDHVVGFKAVTETERFADTDDDTVGAILSEAAKMADEVIAPLQRNGDLNGAVLENGVVRTSPGFKDGYDAIANGGWVGISGNPEYGGMGLPFTLAASVNDMLSGACLALGLNPLLTQGQIEALEAHASDAMKDLYLPKLNSGEWTGTMNLTEPQAGSDVGAVATKAVANDDGTYAITGQKIYISWGDHDVAGNVCHLVLARLPDGKPGTKGISLFMVPKFIPDDDGNPGKANDLRVVSLEHKMGLHGSPTCVMSYEGATGWIVGEEHAGMAAMFTMMNNARLLVGIQGVGVAEGAYQHALAYALERKQGRSPIENGQGTIVDFADVRRMLIQMKAETYAARAIALACSVAIDMSHATGEDEWEARAAFLTPIAKSYGTDTGIKVSELGVQVHGGMGYVEETGAAQYSRDVRVTSIYEGTNGIQAMDLVARKMMDGGDMAFRLLDEIETDAEACRGTFGDMADAVFGAAETLREATEWLLEQELQDRFAGAVPYQAAFARVLGAHFHLRSAVAEGGEGPRTELARFYIERVLPEHDSLLKAAQAGAEGLYGLSVEALAS